MNYTAYTISISSGSGLKFLRVVACSIEAAHADIRAAYGEDVDIVGTVIA